HRGSHRGAAGSGGAGHPRGHARRRGPLAYRRSGGGRADGRRRSGHRRIPVRAVAFPRRLGLTDAGGALRVAMISEHASPLAALGTVDAGGQNAYVAALAAALSGQGHEVRVYTRRDRPDLPATVRLGDRLRVVHVPAGPAEPIPKDELLPYMSTFANVLADA